MSRLLIVGSVAFDDLELPSGDFKNVWGGSASYAALAASLFAPIDLCAVIGEDFPDEHLATMKAHGVDVAGVERAKGRSFR